MKVNNVYSILNCRMYKFREKVSGLKCADFDETGSSCILRVLVCVSPVDDISNVMPEL